MKRGFSPEAIRATRIAEEAIRQLLTAGEAPTPEAFTRAFKAVQAALEPKPSAGARAAHAYAAASNGAGAAPGATGAAGGHTGGYTGGHTGGYTGGHTGGSGSGQANDATNDAGNGHPKGATQGARAPTSPNGAADREAVQAALQAAVLAAVQPLQARAAADQRRLNALLAASLAALGASLPPERAEGPPCVALAVRLLASGDALSCAEELERAIEAAAQVQGGGTLPWREVSGEALRHLTALLPDGDPVASDLLAARSAIRHAKGAELAAALDSAHRILKRSVLGE